MSLIGDLRSALKSNLDSIPNVNVSKYALSSPKGTMIHMWPTGVTYHRAFGQPPGLSEVMFTVQAVAEFSNDFGPQVTIDNLLDIEGDSSLREAVESDRTLGGLCDDLFCDPAEGYQFSVGMDSQLRLTAEWVVTIYVSS